MRKIIHPVIHAAPTMLRPLLTLVVLAAAAATAASQSWNALGTGVDGPVRCLAVYENELYAGGEFAVAGGAPAANIAKWNGMEWSPLGSGTDGAVFALFVHDGRLIVGGSFTSCGGMACSYVASWDGAGWTPVGRGLNGPVFAIAEYQRTLYIGGEFTRAGTDQVNRMAALDGDRWRDVSGGFVNTVYALEVTAFNDLYADLYAGGAFTQPDLSRIAWYHPAYQRWLATEWGGFNAPVFAFANYDDGLVAGGSFTSAGAGSRANRLAKRGSDFYGGADGDVYALHSEGSHLYAGGSFGRVGPAPGLEAANIASWNGGGWEALGSGTNDTVRALAVFQGLLHAGGEFDSAGGVAVSHVARWGAATRVGPMEAESPVSIRLLQNYPNPFNPGTTIRYELPQVSEVRLTVFNPLGLRVATLVEGRRAAGLHEVRFDASGLASGAYLCQLRVRPLDFPSPDSASGQDSGDGPLIGRNSGNGARDVVQTKRLLLLR